MKKGLMSRYLPTPFVKSSRVIQLIRHWRIRDKEKDSNDPFEDMVTALCS